MEHHKSYEASFNSLSSIVLFLNKLKIGEKIQLKHVLYVDSDGEWWYYDDNEV